MMILLRFGMRRNTDPRGSDFPVGFTTFGALVNREALSVDLLGSALVNRRAFVTIEIRKLGHECFLLRELQINTLPSREGFPAEFAEGASIDKCRSVVLPEAERPWEGPHE